MATGVLKWGILGAGTISHDFVRVLQTLPADEHQVVAVAARQLENAAKFAENLNIPRKYSSYDELGTDSEVDVVYVGVIHPHHAEWSKKMMKAGKHVLCEKPVTMNSRELDEVLTVAKQTGKFFMEAFWSRFFPVYQRLKEELSKGLVGDLKLLKVDLGKNVMDVPRVLKNELGGGSLLDMGCYCVQLADFIFGPGMPEKICSSGIVTGDVDEVISITLVYPGKKMAVLTSSMSCELPQKAIIAGTNGMQEIPVFFAPQEITFPFGTERFPVPPVDGLNHPDFCGMIHEAERVRQCILNCQRECPLMTHHSSRNIMAIMDEARRQIGVVYDADK